MKHKSSKYFRNNKLINRKLQEYPKKAVDDIQAYQKFLDSLNNDEIVNNSSKLE